MPVLHVKLWALEALSSGSTEARPAHECLSIRQPAPITLSLMQALSAIMHNPRTYSRDLTSGRSQELYSYGLSVDPRSIGFLSGRAGAMAEIHVAGHSVALLSAVRA